MCGIVGFVSDKKIKVSDLILGLKKLEYRGYDSSGIAYNCDNKIKYIKKTGRISELEKVALDHNLLEEPFYCGIAHTRWATHGMVSEQNSHPHMDCKEQFAVIHNGIIENFQELKNQLEDRGHVFKSQTDSEVIVHLIEENFKKDLLQAVLATLNLLKGTYAIAVMHKDSPNEIIAARKGSPLVVSNIEGISMLASDVTPLLKYSKDMLFLNDGEVAVLTPNKYYIYDLEGKPIHRNPTKIFWDESLAEKSGYPHFMLKEIFEQPHSLKSALVGRLVNGEPQIQEIKYLYDFVKNKMNKIYVVACGTSYHAGVATKYFVNKYSNIDFEIEVASEFRYMNPQVDDRTLVLAISQSGETIDTLEGVRIAKNKGAFVLAISNVVGSTISRESDAVLYMNTGPEIGVAATKTYTAQIALLYTLASQIIYWKYGKNNEIEKVLKEIEKVPKIYEELLNNTNGHMMELVKKYKNFKDMMYIGRNFGYPAAMEGALKLKEISYINAIAYQAGELKHGPIALLDENFPVFAIVPFGGLRDKMISNIMEVKARGAKVIVLVSKEDTQTKKIADDFIDVPIVSEPLLPLIVAPLTQLFAYYIAIEKHLDPDKPRNLAKSVTVE
ncbi:glutamine--fructose-6-phosphate transaminase (isomerizing) [Petrotoga sp. 9PWA.NaAc.5.4]|uniref:glutamine--fructose-6-phosphate transaminase (isomerizing) n=1 Tax=Petrotoga sp. 9PWA.NaAc.5.4 TaxID=1434328 RepID=UPI000CC2D2BC|nr:glutamine--fructose-6-phosphate transaminase (isomerizing) [Petrotoga sp. 9PWA.NaAc.5.4]PNR92534.1 glucosamine--fructose-6-phosphate aminotransferase [Petrotoga sp. 9PWA.NaAc.5.4]